LLHVGKNNSTYNIYASLFFPSAPSQIQILTKNREMTVSILMQTMCVKNGVVAHFQLIVNNEK